MTSFAIASPAVAAASPSPSSLPYTRRFTRGLSPSGFEAEQQPTQHSQLLSPPLPPSHRSLFPPFHSYPVGSSPPPPPLPSSRSRRLRSQPQATSSTPAAAFIDARDGEVQQQLSSPLLSSPSAWLSLSPQPPPSLSVPPQVSCAAQQQSSPPAAAAPVSPAVAVALCILQQLGRSRSPKRRRLQETREAAAAEPAAMVEAPQQPAPSRRGTRHNRSSQGATPSPSPPPAPAAAYGDEAASALPSSPAALSSLVSGSQSVPALLLSATDWEDDDDEVWQPPSPLPRSPTWLSSPPSDAIARRTRAHEDMTAVTLDELEERYGPLLDQIDGQQAERPFTRAAAAAEGERGGGEGEEEDRADEDGSEAQAAHSTPSPSLAASNQFSASDVAGMGHGDLGMYSLLGSELVSEDDEEYAPPAQDEDEDVEEEYRNDRTTRVSKRELRELRGDADVLDGMLEMGSASKKRRRGQQADDSYSPSRLQWEAAQPAETQQQQQQAQMQGQALHRSSAPTSRFFDSSSFSSAAAFAQGSSISAAEAAAAPVPVSLVTAPVYLMSDGSLQSIPQRQQQQTAAVSETQSPFVLPAPAPMPAAAEASVAADAEPPPPTVCWTPALLRGLSYQVNDHLQLLFQSRCLSQWWPEQNADVQRIQSNTATMTQEVQDIQLAAAKEDRRSVVDVPMLAFCAHIASREAQQGAPLLQAASLSLEDERLLSLPLLDDLYDIASHHLRLNTDAAADDAAAVPAASASSSGSSPYSSPPSLSVPELSEALAPHVLAADWNSHLRPLLRLQRVPRFTASEDALLSLAFSSPSSPCYYPPSCTSAIYPDWRRLQQRFLPGKSEREIRKRFFNLRQRPEPHPLKRIRLRFGSKGTGRVLTLSEMQTVERGLQQHGRNHWAVLCSSSFTDWDRRALKRAYQKSKKLGPAAEEEEEDEAQAEQQPPVAQQPAPPPSPPLSPMLPQPPQQQADGQSSSPLPVLAAGCSARVPAESVWTAACDRVLLQSARSHGSVVADWPSVLVTKVQQEAGGEGDSQQSSPPPLSVRDMQNRLLHLVSAIKQAMQGQR